MEIVESAPTRLKKQYYIVYPGAMLRNRPTGAKASQRARKRKQKEDCTGRLLNRGRSLGTWTEGDRLVVACWNAEKGARQKGKE